MFDWRPSRCVLLLILSKIYYRDQFAAKQTCFCFCWLLLLLLLLLSKGLLLSQIFRSRSWFMLRSVLLTLSIKLFTQSSKYCYRFVGRAIIAIQVIAILFDAKPCERASVVAAATDLSKPVDTLSYRFCRKGYSRDPVWCWCCYYWFSRLGWYWCTKLCERAVAVTRMNVLLLAACNPNRYAKLCEQFCLNRVSVLMLSILSNWCVLLLLILLKVYYLKPVAAKQTCSCWLLLLSKGLLLSRSSGRDPG